jgi:hypothetical protein
MSDAVFQEILAFLARGQADPVVARVLAALTDAERASLLRQLREHQTAAERVLRN